MKRRLFVPALLCLLGLAACSTGSSPDNQAPVVALTASPGTVSAAGNVTLTATATDNVRVVKVEFYDGATLLNTVTSTPYTYSQAVTAAQNGAHAYTAKAYDAAGNVGTSSPQAVTVSISTSLPAGIWDSSNWDGATFQ